MKFEVYIHTSARDIVDAYANFPSYVGELDLDDAYIGAPDVAVLKLSSALADVLDVDSNLVQVLPKETTP